MFYFASRLFNLTVVLKPATKTIIGGEIVKNPGINAAFKSGIFTTEDEGIAKMLRAVKDPNVTEITAEDRAAFYAKTRGPKSVRGPMTAQAVKKGDTLQMAEQSKKEFPCVICGTKLKSQQGLDLHLVGHRASSQGAEKAAIQEKEKPAEQ